MSEFKIKDGVLMEYYGNASEVFVPEGVTEIAPSVFAEWRTVACERIIHLPKGLKKDRRKSLLQLQMARIH